MNPDLRQLGDINIRTSRIIAARVLPRKIDM
jgi:hypothetical protein